MVTCYFFYRLVRDFAMTSPQTLLKAWNLRARKAFGQNFLINQGTAQRIVAHARLNADDVVLEIGSGLGVMTTTAARQARKIIAVEKDRNLVPLLKAELLVHGFNHVCVYEQDILKTSLKTFYDEHEAQPMVVLGNLPYNISSQIVVKLIEERQHIDRAVLMFQKELADRLCAGPGTKVYGRLSVRLQYCAQIDPLLHVGAAQFYPRPKVDSALLGIRFKTRIEHAVNDEHLFALVVQAAFGQRRKNLRNALSGSLLSLDRAEAVQLLEASEIDPRRRAETLSVDAFVSLTNHIDGYLKSRRRL
jgi:16S rRNA (adenine1518-N6/adenine1519-N6)-dimethyltransferase